MLISEDDGAQPLAIECTIIANNFFPKPLGDRSQTWRPRFNHLSCCLIRINDVAPEVSENCRDMRLPYSD